MTSPATDEGCMQENVFAFLGDPKVHPDTQRIDTHAASVFLQGDRALKIKRAVRFPFLDYSTLARRKSACDEELRINQPFAPQIYRRVVPITRDPDGELQIDGQGPPVEYAVEMARFDERRTIDHLAQSGPLDSALVEAIADAIAASHEVAPRVPERPWISSIPGLIERLHPGLPRCGLLFERRHRRSRQHIADGIFPSSRRARAAQRAGISAALPRRPASGEHRSDRGQARAVRCDRVRRDDRVHRRAL